MDETERKRLTALAVEMMPVADRGEMMHQMLEALFNLHSESFSDDEKAALICVGTYLRCAIDAERAHPEHFYRAH
jgi:hypothetical protein